MSEPPITDQILPTRLFRVTRSDGTEQAVMAHLMNIVEGSGALCFYLYKTEELAGQTVVIQYCVHTFSASTWLEAREESLPTVSGKAH